MILNNLWSNNWPSEEQLSNEAILKEYIELYEKLNGESIKLELLYDGYVSGFSGIQLHHIHTIRTKMLPSLRQRTKKEQDEDTNT